MLCLRTDQQPRFRALKPGTIHYCSVEKVKLATREHGAAGFASIDAHDEKTSAASFSEGSRQQRERYAGTTYSVDLRDE
jgi:hypothetical protein